jgi:hypothetical protein
MDKKRKAYAPFSLTSEAGVAQTPVEGYIDVNQSIYPIVNTGVVNENGKWEGVKASDSEFRIFAADLAVANGASILAPTGPATEENFIDMSGFNDIIIAVKPSEAGNYAIEAVMGPDTNPFANLTPVVGEAVLRGAGFDGRNVTVFEALVDDSQETLTADHWNLFYIGNMLQNQKMMQFKIVNNSGNPSDIQFAYMRLV